MHEGYDFIDDFVVEMKKYLDECEEKRGDVWLRMPQETQADTLHNYFNNLFMNHFSGGEPVNWVSIAVEAMLASVRDADPERFPE